MKNFIHIVQVRFGLCNQLSLYVLAVIISEELRMVVIVVDIVCGGRDWPGGLVLEIIIYV